MLLLIAAEKQHEVDSYRPRNDEDNNNNSDCQSHHAKKCGQKTNRRQTNRKVKEKK